MLSTENLNIDNNLDTPMLDVDYDFGFNLYDTQKQVLYLMNELEQNKSIKKDNVDLFYKYIKLAPCFSFGKTIVTLALLCLRNIPISRDWDSIYVKSVKYPLRCLVKRKYYMDTSLIIVSPVVFFQWKEHLNKTDLKYICIDSIDKFEILITNLINNIQINYDVILLVYMKLNKYYPLPFGGNNVISKTEKSNINILALLSTNTLWKRVIIDDFDTIRLTKEMMIPANIIWLISATTNRIPYINDIPFTVTSINNRILNSLYSTNLDDLSITCNVNFEANIPIIKINSYIFNDAYLMNKIINDLEYSNEISEKINSGDINGAAGLLGISVNCNTMGQIFSYMFEKNKKIYFNYNKLLKRFCRIINLVVYYN